MALGIVEWLQTARAAAAPLPLTNGGLTRRYGSFSLNDTGDEKMENFVVGTRTSTSWPRRGFLKAIGTAVAASALPVTVAKAAQALTASYPASDSKTIRMKDGTTLFYKDWGSGQPIVFHHGWPLSADD